MDLSYFRSLNPHIVIYSQDGLGLGHMRRTSSIVYQFLKVLPGASVLTLSDSQLGQFFGMARNHDYIKLPSIVKDGPGAWRAANLPLSFPDVHTMRRELISSALLSLLPDIVLVDHMPHGAMGELIPAFEALKAGGACTKIVLGLRDILDAPEVIQEHWKSEGAYEALHRYYDQVLVYGMRDVYDVAQQYQFPAEIAEKVRYCGYVCTPTLPRYGAKVRAQNLLKDQADAKLIVAMAGGGADAYPMMKTLLDAFPLIQAERPCVLVLITGPFMPADLRHDLEARARGLAVRVKMSVNDSLSYMNAADLVVSMAGYNTTMEILSSGKRAILIPRAGPSAEQRTRAKLFSERGWVEIIDPDELEPVTVSERIVASLERKTDLIPLSEPDLQGVHAAVDNLLTLLPIEDECKVLKVKLEEESFNGIPF